MRPKDLKHPLTWEERRPLIEDRVFFVPDYYFEHQKFTFPGWGAQKIFQQQQPIRIEYCCGNGSWLLSRALLDLKSNWVGVEIRFDRVRKLWSKIKNAGLENVFIVCGEALTFTTHYVPEGSVEEIFINFPDPWPKERHAKHRLMKPLFIEELGRILKKEGKITFVTDDEDYLQQTLTFLLASPSFQPLSPPPHFVTEKEGYGTSFFDSLWRQKGREIHYLEFVKR